ncbi:MAG: hypothetical protein JOZ54_10760 [Acidobacteria bacterium]|nr:hypothetical protein [Acidobacteriota bacterium]
MKANLLFLLLLLCPFAASAQDVEAWAGVPIHFDTAGARSLAMGATTVAVTNEPSLVSSNPASLASIGKRTFAAEYRSRTTRAQYFSGASWTNFDTTQANITSATLVLPQQGVTWAAFFDEPQHSAQNNGLLPINSTLFIPARVFTQLQRYGLGAGWKRGNLSAGATVHYDSMRMQSSRYVMAPQPNTIPYTEILYANDNAIAWNAGLQWQAAPAVTVGAVYARGAQFDVQRQAFGYFDGVPVPTVQWTYHTPSSMGVGAAWNGVPNLTVAADAVRINYQEMTPQVFIVGSLPPVLMREATELHAGAEYRVTPHVAVRAGWWRDPAHGPAPYSLWVLLPEIRASLQPDVDQDHVTAGVGIGTERLRFDAAYDHSERTRRASFGIATTF